MLILSVVVGASRMSFESILLTHSTHTVLSMMSVVKRINANVSASDFGTRLRIRKTMSASVPKHVTPKQKSTRSARLG
jgi:hypothetical protein